MTRKNTSLRTKPFLLEPSYKERLWGGNRLKDDFAKNIDAEGIGEAWECSTHKDGPSLVVSGKHKGEYLSDVISKNPEYLGSKLKGARELPILIKLIDAKRDLSIQVHPNDEYAKINENGSLGKTEMWYVLDASKNATLIYGLCRDTEKEKLLQSIKEGAILKHLNRISVKRDDVFFIEAGTIHGIGAGTLVAEIQQNSNITYRLYDYDRTDKKGNKRELHTDKALEAASLKETTKPKQPLRVLKYKPGCACELLCRCKYFKVERWLVNTEICRNMVSLSTGSSSFCAMLCVSGCGSLIEAKNGNAINFFKGDCIFIPANSAELKIHGRGQLLMVSC